MTHPDDPQRTRAFPGQDPAYGDPVRGGPGDPAPVDPRRPRPAEQEVVHERVEDTYASRVRTIRMVNTAITFICGLFAVVLVAQIILTLAEANADNGFASFIRGFSGGVSLGFDGLFTPDSAKAATLFNYGFAAIVWLLIGAALTYLIRKFALPGPRREVRYRRSVE